MALPNVSERVSHAEPNWFVKKGFIQFADHHHDDRVGFWCAAPDGAQKALVGAEPTRFYKPPYYGVRGWLGVYLDVPNVDWALIESIVEDAYRCTAPAKAIAELDARRSRS